MSEPKMEGAVEQPLTPEEQAIFDADVKDLTEAEEKYGMKGKLAGRVKFGLDPAGMMVMRESAPLTAKLAEALGTTPEKVWPLIKELHEKGPWELADRLTAAAEPEIKAYLVMADACHESGWPGYTPAKYLEDRTRVIDELGSFTADKFEERRKHLQERIGEMELIPQNVNGKEIKVPIVSTDAALPLSTQGYKGCVVRQGEMRFAQTANIPDSLLEGAGLTPGFAEVFSPEKQGFERVSYEGRPAGARVVWVEQSQAGKPLEEMEPAVKRIAPGFLLTYANEGLAVSLVAKAVAEKE